MKDASLGVRRSTALVGALLLSAPFARAGDVEFNPTLAVGLSGNSNVDVLGTTDRSGGSYRLYADLPLTYRTSRDTLNASYKPGWTTFRGDAEGEDFFSHTLLLSWDRTLSRRADLTLKVDAVRTESQAISQDTPDTALTFVEKTPFARYGLSVGGQVQTQQSSNVSWGAGLRAQTLEDIEPSPENPTGTDFNDARGGTLEVGWTAQTGPDSSNGVFYRYDRVEFENTLTSDAHTLTWRNGARLGRDVTTSVGLGVSYGKSRIGSDVLTSLDASLTRNIGAVSALSVGARQGWGPGGGTSGATQDQGVYLSWSHAPRFMSTVLTAGWWRRAAASFGGTPSAPTSKAWSVAASFAWQFGRWVALGLSGNYSKQSDPDTEFYSYGLFLRWNIRGR